MAHQAYERSIPEIIADLLGQFPALVRKETQLARTEISEKITQIGLGIALIAGGAVLLIPALVILLEAAVAALERAGFDPPVAALIAGGGALLIGIILLLVGISRLKAENMVPQKTIHQIQQDASMAKRQVRSDDDYQRAA
jgi:Putative Actinobacterial Holin-X, holin superfamily III